jgi:general secretion pathway protein L
MNIDITRYIQALRIRHIAPLGRELARFLTWWKAELLGLLSGEIRERVERRNQTLFVEAGDGNLKLRVGNSLKAGVLRRVALDNSACGDVTEDLQVVETVALLPAEKVLRTTLQLPLAAEENLREVIAFEMDRHTPFIADMVYFDFSVTRRDTEKRALSVELAYTTRRDADRFLGALERFNIRPGVLSSRDKASGEPFAFNLLPTNSRKLRATPIRRLNVALGSAVALLLVVAMASPAMQRAGAANTLDSQVKAAAATAKQATELRDDVAKLAEGAQILAVRRQERRLVVELIDEISHRLPDHTWIDRLDIAGDSLQLQGRSRSAADLIRIVEASPLLANARFSSPVSQVSTLGIDQFHLSADIIWERK